MTNATKKTTVKTTAAVDQTRILEATNNALKLVASRQADRAAEFAEAASKPSPKSAPKAWDSSLSTETRANAMLAVAVVVGDIENAEASNKVAAQSMATLHARGFHTAASMPNFADWFMLCAAHIGNVPSKATVYRLTAAGAILTAMGGEAAAECVIPMDGLATLAGNVKGKPQDAKGSIARQASKKFNASRASGSTVVEAMEDAGIRKPKTSADSGESLDLQAKIARISIATFSLSGQSYAEAFQILHGAIDRLKALQAASIATAKG
jgi:hypothetical protein